jgi:hypothetical protein
MEESPLGFRSAKLSTTFGTSRKHCSQQSYYIVERANHMSLYDVSKYADKSGVKLAPFFKANL